MQRQCVPSPRSVLPSTEVPQEPGAARLPHQGEVIESQLLEAPPESPTILYFSRDEQAPPPLLDQGAGSAAGSCCVMQWMPPPPRNKSLSGTGTIDRSG